MSRYLHGYGTVFVEIVTHLFPERINVEDEAGPIWLLSSRVPRVAALTWSVYP